MSKVVLLSINAKYVHSSLAVWVIAAGVSKYAVFPHSVSIVEATINQPDPIIAEQIMAHQPDFIGISAYIWNARKLPGLLKLLRELLPDALQVLGGPEASNNADYWLACGADYVLCGEGEYTLPILLDRESKGTAPLLSADCDKYPDTEEGMQRNRPRDSHTHQTVDPYSPEYFARLAGRIAYIETSRGCPFQCAFCLSAGSGLRFFPVDTAKEQLRKLSESGTHTVKFVDRTFNCETRRAYELFEYIIALDTTCCFHFEVAADLFDARTLELLATAPPGRIQLEAGLQSFFEPALTAASRQTNLDKAQQNIRALLRERNIHIHIDLIAGLPYETLHDFQDSFDRAFILGAHTLQLGFLKLLHGSVLREQAESMGISYAKEAPYEILCSPWLSQEDIQILKQTENALQHTYNKCRFLSTLEYVRSTTKMRPFSLFQSLGETAPNHGTQLDKYAVQIYDFCVKLSGVDRDELCDRMTYDWLGMVKGRNMPDFLKHQDSRRSIAVDIAKKQLGREPRRDEVAVLRSGKGIFADSENRDPVTGLYTVYYTHCG